jgi:hypothetical protein
MGNLTLPQPTKNARDVNAVTIAIAETFIPGASLLKKYLDFKLNRNIEVALELLVTEVKKSGIEILSDAQYEFYIPSAYRFAEQVRLGDYEHNLGILRRILIGSLNIHSSDTGKIGRHARQLEYLSEFEIDVLAASYELLTPTNERTDKDKIFSANFIKKQISRFCNKDPFEIQFALSVLSTRGLLTTRGELLHDDAEAGFSSSPDGLSIFLSASLR